MVCSPTTPSGCNEIIDVADSVMLYPLVSIQSRQSGVSIELNAKNIVIIPNAFVFSSCLMYATF